MDSMCYFALLTDSVVLVSRPACIFVFTQIFTRANLWFLIQISSRVRHKCIFMYVTGDGNRRIHSPSSDIILPKTERPKSLDLSGEPRSLRLPVPQLGSAKQHHLACDRLQGVEEEEKETDKEKPQVETDASCSVGSVRRMGIETGFDPLTLMTMEAAQEGEESGSKATTRRHLAEEIEMYMNNASSPLRSRTPSMDLQNPSSPATSSPRSSPRPSTLLRSNTNLQMPVKSKERLRPSPSLPLGNRERPSSMVSPSSPTPSTSSFSMDSLFPPTLDIFKSSVISAGKGVAEKASRLYSRLSSQTSLTQVGRTTFLTLTNSHD